MRFTSRQVLGIFLALIVGLFSLGSWYSFSILMLGSGSALRSFLWFFCLISVFLAGAVIWEQRSLRMAGAALLFLPSIVFIFSWYHAAVLCIVIACAWWSIRDVQNEIDSRIRFHFWKSVHAGQFALVFALSLALSSGYFSFSQGATLEELVPELHVGEGASASVLKMAAYLYPGLKQASDESMTVDEFLMHIQAGQQGNGTSSEKSFSDAAMENLKKALYGFPSAVSSDTAQQAIVHGLNATGATLADEAYLRSGRAQISALVGRAVSGNEKISEVFSLVIQSKIAELFSDKGAISAHVPSRIIPLILAVMLFLTLMPIGSLLGPGFALIGFFIFALARMAGWVRIVPIEREQEILAE